MQSIRFLRSKCFGVRPLRGHAPRIFSGASAAAAGIALIISPGNLGGLFGPYVTGMAKQRTFGSGGLCFRSHEFDKYTLLA